MSNRPKHPSGSPIRDRKVVGRPIWRIPDDGYVTPRLRRQDGAQAIGFIHRFDSEESDE